MSENYHDINGKPCSLYKLVRDEPEWAVSTIRRLRIALAEASPLMKWVADEGSITARAWIKKHGEKP